MGGAKKRKGGGGKKATHFVSLGVTHFVSFEATHLFPLVLSLLPVCKAHTLLPWKQTPDDDDDAERRKGKLSYC